MDKENTGGLVVITKRPISPISHDRKVMFNSDEAAKIQTVTGWVSGAHFFWDDEDLARFSGCTHKICACGNEMIRYYTKCRRCRDKAADDRFLALPARDWNGDIFYSQSADKYFYDESDLADYCNDNSVSETSLNLVECQPIHMKPIDDDFWYDDCPDDQYIEDIAPKDILAQLSKLNKMILEQKPILCWMPGNARLNPILPTEAKK